MIVRRRLRTILAGIGLHVIAAGAIVYFGFHAYSGDRGLIAKEVYRTQMAELTAELETLTRERQDWALRVSLMRPDALDPDIVDERARDVLNMVHPKDVTWFVDRQPAR
jgi:cell division protein FtsB